ncbi:MAG: hypothetical protein JSW65_05445 [Candidatus Bipolaricaulota bacterium]|nr:MAG: hypothetical protein JSW65_05445 [Candidatus Bipolaricaulota bacterium]
MGVQLLVGVVAALVVVLLIWLGAKRRKELAAWATSRGLAFRPAKDAGFDERYRDFTCLRRGHSRWAQNIMSGDWEGHAVTAFDYRYVTGHGKNRSVHHFSAAIVASEIPLKPLKIRPEGLFDRVTEFFGADDIDFESAEFSREFHVKSVDPRWAYDVLHQRTMEFLLSMPRFSIQFSEREVIAWRARRFSPQAFDQAIRVVAGVLDRLPPYVREIQEGR